MTILDRILQAQELLGKSHDSSPSSEEKELLDLAIDALWFIWRDGLSDQFEDYRKDIQSDAPARVVAAFDTREDADAWLAANPRPPGSAYVLVADEYHIVVYFRDRNYRALIPHPTLEFHLEEMMRDGLPPAAVVFNTRGEADAWFNGQAEPPAQTVIQIGGERYLAVYYRNINHRALFPFSLVKRKKEKEGTGP
ncbi:head protein [Vitiosangium sp. GDMCC 1.1324]|uniref:head protein n=1 Tax=Vitiosangium sp. (strain GDMCC 1.1324) TaxID=2138576 RepID=UPI000D335024|nr:head protein [Vitiosangium sp. GDMCC 1.1324]PTL79876.1 head protein [Vitiosangium sp. GDMCC 1.1324]